MKRLLLFIHILCSLSIAAQTPIFGPEKSVTINGYGFDEMEPCLSPDGNAMFFNSLNNAINTTLFLSSYVNDTTFNLVSAVPVVNEVDTPYLNAVASLDTANVFYWVSLRDYGIQYDNLHRVHFPKSGGAAGFARVHGDFNIASPGWLVMDACINYDGSLLYYCNAFFNTSQCAGPCKASMGVAQKVNDSTFNKLPNTNSIFANINDTNYAVYAPCISSDELELYFTRYKLNQTPVTEICVSTRTNKTAPFGPPSVLVNAGTNFAEAASLSTDKNRMYYHKKVGGTYKLFMRYRVGTTEVPKITRSEMITISNMCASISNTINKAPYRLFSIDGRLVKQGTFAQGQQVCFDNFPVGTYLLEVMTKDQTERKKLVLY